MRARIIVVLLLMTTIAAAQINDSATLRSVTNTRITANNTRSITAPDLNLILNGFLNLMQYYKTKGVDSISVINDSTFRVFVSDRNGSRYYDRLVRGTAAGLSGGTFNKTGGGVTHTGDSLYLPDAGITPGVYGDGANIPQVQVDSKGRTVGIGAVSNTPGWSFITGKPSFGTASGLNVPSSGDAGSGEVVKGNDSRLTTNLGTARAATQVTVLSSTGASAIIGSADTTSAGVMSKDDKKNLDFYRTIVNIARPAGVVFADNFARSSLGTNYTSVGSSFTFPSSAYLQLTSGVGDFSNYIIRNQTISTHRHIDTVIFVPTVKNSSSFGLAIGVQSWQAGTKRDLLAQYSVATTTLLGNTIIYGQPVYPTDTLVTSASLSFSALDTLMGILERDDTKVTSTYKNLTTGTSITTSYTFPTNSTSGYLVHNTGNPVLYNIGGTNNVLYWSVTNNQGTTNDVIIGNSLVSYDAGAYETSWPYLLYNARSDYSVVCGPGDRTAQALTQLPELAGYSPRKVFVDIGINDLLSGVSASTFSTQYDSICHYLANLHIPVYLISLSPTTTDVRPFNDTIQLKAAKYGCTFIDIFNWLKDPAGYTLASMYDGGDGLHWSNATHSLVALLLQPYRSRYSNNVPAGGASNAPFILTTNGTSGAAELHGNILNIPQYFGLSDLTAGRFPIASGVSTVSDYPELTWSNSDKRVNINGTLHIGDGTTTYAGCNTLTIGGSGTAGVLDMNYHGNRISEFYTTSSNFNMFTDVSKPFNIYTNNSLLVPNIYAFSQKVGINTATVDSTLTVNGGIHNNGGVKFDLLASGNASPSQTGIRVAMNIDANGRVGTFVPSLESALANGADLSNSYTTNLGANDWLYNQNSTGRLKIKGLSNGSGTDSVVTTVNGELKKIAQSSLGGGATITDVRTEIHDSMQARFATLDTVIERTVTTTDANPVYDTIFPTAGADYETITLKVSCIAMNLNTVSGYFKSYKEATYLIQTSGTGLDATDIIADKNIGSLSTCSTALTTDSGTSTLPVYRIVGQTGKTIQWNYRIEMQKNPHMP